MLRKAYGAFIHFLAVCGLYALASPRVKTEHSPKQIQPDAKVEEDRDRALGLCDQMARDWGARARRYRRRFRQYKYLTVILAVTVTVLSGIEAVPDWVVTVSSGFVALFTGLLAATQAQDLWVQSRGVQTKLYAEKFLYLQSAGPYAEIAGNDRESVSLFSQRIEDVLLQGHKGWARSIGEI